MMRLRRAIRVARRLVLLVLLVVTGVVGGLAGASSSPMPDGSRDFDFEFGDWSVEISRLLQPLTGSTEWAEYEGTSIVRKVWGGRANLGELEVEGPSGRIQGLSLRLYNPETRQWSIHWANSRDGSLGPPMVGGFRDGVGEFYNQEMFNGRSVFVRFIFSDITSSTFRLEQAFSADGGKSWEANWIARFRRPEPPPSETRQDAADVGAIRALWSELDDAWNEREAERFSTLFTADASFELEDPRGGASLAGRAEIRRHFEERFPRFPPELRHSTSVRQVHILGSGLRAVDGKVEILSTADAGSEPALVRSFAIFGVMLQAADGWQIQTLRAYLLPTSPGAGDDG